MTGRRRSTDSRGTADEVNHPPHYVSHPSGVECITIVEHYNFNVGNAIKYLWRAGLKRSSRSTDVSQTDHVESTLIDLRKAAAWYVQREIDRLQRKTYGRVD